MSTLVPFPSRITKGLASSVALVAIALALSGWARSNASATEIAPGATVSLAANDTSLVRHIEHTSARIVEGRRVYRLTLKAGTSKTAAAQLADYVSEGGEPGSLTIIGDDFTVERSHIKRGTVPLPPPPPPARFSIETRESGTLPPPPPPARRSGDS